MYDNSRLPAYMNVLSRPYDTQFSRWSLHTPNSPAVNKSTVPKSTVTLSSSFYAPQSPQVQRSTKSHYVNLPPLQQTIPRTSMFHGQRPKSTMICDSISAIQSSNAYLNDLRQRYESKAIVGIVKPMVHQRSYNQLNDENHHNNHDKLSSKMRDSQSHQFTHAVYPSSPSPPLPPPPPSTAAGTSSVVYRSRRHHPSQIHFNGQPPAVPRRHSSISNNKYFHSHRSSRTTSTCSSVAPTNELSLTSSSSSHEDDYQRHNETPILDVKRLEMFYSSVGTVIRSARCVARLYLTTRRQLAGLDDWSCQQQGVPLWIYNTGANLKRSRQIRLLLAQPDSCFSVWSTLISNQVEVRLPKDHYVTCWLPEANLLAVLKFEREDACRLFFRHYYEILESERKINLNHPMPPLPAADPSTETNLIEQPTSSVSNSKEVPRRYSRLRSFANKAEKDQPEQTFELRRCRSLSRIRTVKKSAISGPINFEHVNHVSNSSRQERSSSGTMTLRSLHASMSNLTSHGSFADRSSNSSRKRTSIAHEIRTTEV